MLKHNIIKLFLFDYTLAYMDIKKHLNRKEYIEILRKMTPEQKLLKTFELSEFGKELFICGLKKRFPDLNDQEFHKLLLDRLEKCHNRNY